MKPAIVVLLLACAHVGKAQLTYETVGVDYDSAWKYKSLQLVPIRAKGPGGGGGNTISLSRAIREGLVTMSERGSASTENVHWLRLNNRSDKTLYISSGETFSGGRQDRMVSADTLLRPTGRDQYIPVMCIEEGRWSEKERKIVYVDYADVALRRVLDRSHNQVLVWKEVLAQLDSAGVKAPTLAYHAFQQNKTIVAKEDEYLRFFSDRLRNADSSIIGIICVTGGRVIGSDIFRDRNMFFDELEPLLRGYIREAVLRGSEPVLPDKDIKLYMDKILTNEKMQDDYCRKNGKIFRDAGRVIHVTSY